eukprot:CAMPEP_0172577498 /NCGR_PEP_ID=MMETSP1067-20121228/138264_1 /TAXON_ID=265564 ORGANISM="Thalassiosira punctigera, Strain Tpunct2005C2" /NCGR_SAMPLE_ID=MMETSP1067 /ASSEMBLY_ACC=CAM_ASM_000444 /LENGTH=245 /DNA_ID=CAMNT_0013370185 /DNA_START=342 /DNA_END=1075 /DNA_ORIENTATION=-
MQPSFKKQPSARWHYCPSLPRPNTSNPPYSRVLRNSLLLDGITVQVSLVVRGRGDEARLKAPLQQKGERKPVPHEAQDQVPPEHVLPLPLPPLGAQQVLDASRDHRSELLLEDPGGEALAEEGGGGAAGAHEAGEGGLDAEVRHELREAVGALGLVLLGVARGPPGHDVVVAEVEVAPGAELVVRVDGYVGVDHLEEALPQQYLAQHLVRHELLRVVRRAGLLPLVPPGPAAGDDAPERVPQPRR